MEKSDDTIEELAAKSSDDPGEAQQLFEVGTNEEANLEESNPEDDSEVNASNSCEFCGQYANPKDPSTFSEVRTWVGGPKKDSAVLRVHTGRLAHRNCIELERRGIGANQQNLDELLDEAPQRADVPDDIFTDKPIEWRTGFRHGREGSPIDPPVGESQLADYEDGYRAGIDSRPFAWEVNAQPDRCPACDSPAPDLHPAMQHEGEVQPCKHPWHLMIGPS